MIWLKMYLHFLVTRERFGDATGSGSPTLGLVTVLVLPRPEYNDFAGSSSLLIKRTSWVEVQHCWDHGGLNNDGIADDSSVVLPISVRLCREVFQESCCAATASLSTMPTLTWSSTKAKVCPFLPLVK
jgi:hypothetical protein